MKKPLSILLLSLLISAPICSAQSNSAESKSCEKMVDNLYDRLLTFGQMKYTQGDSLTSVSHLKSLTLSDSLEVNTYFQKITNKQNYYYKYEPAKKEVVLKRGNEIFVDQQPHGKQAFSFLKKKLSSTLTTGSKVYVMELQTQDGITFTDYTACGPKNNNVYNNAFFGLLFFKTKKTTTTSTTSTIHHN